MHLGQRGHARLHGPGAVLLHFQIPVRAESQLSALSYQPLPFLYINSLPFSEDTKQRQARSPYRSTVGGWLAQGFLQPRVQPAVRRQGFRHPYRKLARQKVEKQSPAYNWPAVGVKGRLDGFAVQLARPTRGALPSTKSTSIDLHFIRSNSLSFNIFNRPSSERGRIVG